MPVAALGTLAALALASLTVATLTFARAIVLGIVFAIPAAGLLLLRDLTVLLLRVLAVLATVVPALAAVDETALGLDHAVIVVGILEIGLGLDAIANGGRFTRECLIFIEDLVGVAAHTDVGAAAVEDLIPVRRPVRVVIMLWFMIVVAAAATIAAAARALTIVGSH